MQSLVGIWNLVEARAFDDAGNELPSPLGPPPIGVVRFDAERMVGVVGDGRVTLPPNSPQRLFFAYTGTYTFDGTELLTRADDASKPELIVEQIRHVHFDSPTRIVVVPISGVLGDRKGIEVVWERLG